MICKTDLTKFIPCIKAPNKIDKINSSFIIENLQKESVTRTYCKISAKTLLVRKLKVILEKQAHPYL